MSLLRGVFPDYVATAETAAFPEQDALFPEELQQVRNAVPSRIAEFAAGRWCARQALSTLGVAPAPLLAGADRLPQWPSGTVGSISHSAQYCGAAVAATSAACSLGLDIEPDEPLDEELVQTVCREEELRWLRQYGDDRRLAKLLFSLKECAFKCQFPLTGRYLEFQDVGVVVDLGNREFRALLAGTGLEIEGRYRLAKGLIVAGIIAPPGLEPALTSLRL
jgi:4'-phosphopantetheinyl transferase EntD